eukprot:3558237-Rhodomonas_salina.1
MRDKDSPRFDSSQDSTAEISLGGCCYPAAIASMAVLLSHTLASSCPRTYPVSTHPSCRTHRPASSPSPLLAPSRLSARDLCQSVEEQS